MRIFELTTRVKSISRSAGRTATAAAAYRSGTSIACAFADTEHDYSRKGGVVFSEIVVPETAPTWASERSALWNAAELVEKNGKRGKNAGAWKPNAQTAREVMFSFPHELSEEGRVAVARKVADHLVATGVAADVNIHAPGREGDQRNWHCHILATTRVLCDRGFGKKAAWQTDRAKSRKLSRAIRAFIAQTANDQLAVEGKGALVHVEHRSFKARGVDRQPQTHDGPVKTNTQRRDSRRAREDWQKEARDELRARQVQENKALREAQNAAWRQHSKRWAATTRAEVRHIVERTRAARTSDPRPGVWRSLFLRMTGQSAQVKAQRTARAHERLAAVRREIRALRVEIARQKEAVRADQKSDRQAVKDRHAGETMQLSRAFAARVSKDLSAEQSLRSAWRQASDLQREARTFDRGRSFEP